MTRIIKVENAFDLILLLNHSERSIYGFSLLQNPESPNEPNKGNDEIIEQLHAALNRANDRKLIDEKSDVITDFLLRQYGLVQRRTHSETEVHHEESEEVDDEIFDSEDEDETDEIQIEGANRLSAMSQNGIAWKMYVKYNSESDEILITFLPKKNRDVVELEKEIPEVFLDIMNDDPMLRRVFKSSVVYVSSFLPNEKTQVETQGQIQRFG